MAFCKNCGNEMDDLAVVCVKCGTPKGAGASFCPHCGNPLMPGATVCTSCGVPVNNTAAVNGSEQKSKLAAGLMGILIGSLGIHNFYLGYTTKAVIQLVLTVATCGIGGCFGYGVNVADSNAYAADECASAARLYGADICSASRQNVALERNFVLMRRALKRVNHAP